MKMVENEIDKMGKVERNVVFLSTSCPPKIENIKIH
jgi:hypothetical protein